MNATTQKGFTLIELMIVIAIIGILAAIALPAYQTYTKKARFTEVVLAASSVKGAIDTCYQTRGEGDIANCDSAGEVGADLTGAATGDQVASVEISDGTATTEDSAGTAVTIPAGGVLATGDATSVDGEDFALIPDVTGDSIVWSEAGTCIAAGLC
ncbi:pilin [Psychrobacter sp. Pi2-1]|uniref:pilin n=1 Tax=Psychrobacter sp. Pi2-1 TaxID=2774131 RepID=UPI00191B6F56|nr:prepilin-type N-terminal cleavage/methylation domain-containing protein [Psychrobacter sp. Pi2-1]